MSLKARLFSVFVLLAFIGPVSAEVDFMGTPGIKLAQGHLAIDDGDYAKAIEILTPIAESGNADAQLTLGEMYLYGLGVYVNESVAVQLIKQSATQGNAKAQWKLGSMYDSGTGMEHDPGKSRKWIARSARQGFAIAQHDLASLYEGGAGANSKESDQTLYKDELMHARGKALFLFRRAAKQGYAPSKARIEAMQHYSGRGLKRMEAMADTREKMDAKYCHDDTASERKGCADFF